MIPGWCSEGPRVRGSEDRREGKRQERCALLQGVVLLQGEGVVAEPAVALGEEETVKHITVETLEAFCEMLGTVAGNVALTLGAKGGIYIGGRIVAQMNGFFEQSGFRARFEQKGRFSDYLSHIPTFIITEKYPTLIGMSAMLSAG